MVAASSFKQPPTIDPVTGLHVNYSGPVYFVRPVLPSLRALTLFCGCMPCRMPLRVICPCTFQEVSTQAAQFLESAE